MGDPLLPSPPPSPSENSPRRETPAPALTQALPGAHREGRPQATLLSFTLERNKGPV